MSATQSTPVRAGASAVPYGHIIGSEKWRGTELAQLLQGKVKLVFEDGLGLVDFHLSNRACILYISESDLVSGNAFKRRLVRFRKWCPNCGPPDVGMLGVVVLQHLEGRSLDSTELFEQTVMKAPKGVFNADRMNLAEAGRNASNLKGVVIVEKTRLSDQYFPPVQNFVVLELGMALLPVTSQSEAAQLIFHLVQERSREGASNPYIAKKRCHLSEASILQTVQKIPGVGQVKGLQLLQYFPSIQQLSNASLRDLEAVVGRGIASNIYSFFTPN